MTYRNQHHPIVRLDDDYMDLTAVLLGIRDRLMVARKQAYQGKSRKPLFLEIDAAIDEIDRVHEREAAQWREWQARLAAKE